MSDLSAAINDMWQFILGKANQQGKQYVYERLPKARTDVDFSETPLKPDASYFRLILSDLHLAKSRTWFVDWFPAVHGAVKLEFASRPEVQFTKVAETSRHALSKGIALNYHLTPLLPFSGGSVSVNAGLLALKGDNKLEAAIGILSKFSSLVGPPLTQAITIAEKISGGMQDLVNTSEGVVHLPFTNTFTADGTNAGNPLRSGYYAAVLATSDELTPRLLAVKDNRLHFTTPGESEPQPLTDFDYMLFRIEGQTERDDWRLPSILDPLNEAKKELLSPAPTAERVEAFKKQAILAAWLSPDLVSVDRRRVIASIKEELKEVEQSALGATAESTKRDLGAMVNTFSPSFAKALALGPISYAEAFS